MAKKKTVKKVTKSEFLRDALGRDPELDLRKLNQRWSKEGHPGEISNALFYKVRGELGIRVERSWAPGPASRSIAESTPITGEVYQLEITLLETKPPIWRRIQVADCTLDKLHEHIQTAMGWTNSHLNQFKIEGRLYSDPLLMEETFEELQCKDSTTTLLSEVLPRDGQPYRFEYEYDFGDGWLHEVRFEGRVPAVPGTRYPLCLEGARACPPEDVGGVWGYADFVEAITDPEHERHHELLEWVGGKFNPEKFSPAAATRSMMRGLPDWRSMM